MNQNLILMTKNILFSGIAGTIVYFLVGWLVYGILFPEIHSGPESPMVNIILGTFFYAFFYAVIFVHWSGINTAKTGFNAGLILSIIMAMSWHFFMLDGQFYFMKFLKEIVIGGLTTAIMTATIGFVNGKVA